MRICIRLLGSGVGFNKRFLFGFSFGLGFSGEPGVKRVPRNDLFRWGDKSEFSLLEADGLSFGNLFVGRKGKRVYMITVSGVYFDESKEIREFLGEKLRALERLPAP